MIKRHNKNNISLSLDGKLLLDCFNSFRKLFIVFVPVNLKQHFPVFTDRQHEHWSLSRVSTVYSNTTTEKLETDEDKCEMLLFNKKLSSVCFHSRQTSDTSTWFKQLTTVNNRCSDSSHVGKSDPGSDQTADRRAEVSDPPQIQTIIQHIDQQQRLRKQTQIWNE